MGLWSTLFGRAKKRETALADDRCAKCGKALIGRELITAYLCRTCGKTYCGSCAGYRGGMVVRLSCPACHPA